MIPPAQDCTPFDGPTADAKKIADAWASQGEPVAPRHGGLRPSAEYLVGVLTSRVDELEARLAALEDAVGVVPLTTAPPETP